MSENAGSISFAKSNMVTHIPKTFFSSFEHWLIKRRSRSVGSVDETVFDEILAQYDSYDEVFVHIGLSDIKSAFDTDPYEFIHQKLNEHFSSILVPGFTQSFRDTGEYHAEETEPELGAFSGLFFSDAEYRTPDPLHSILVSGNYRFKGCNFRNTFAEDGCYGQLESDNVLYLNVGTQWLVSTQLHYIEQVLDVPYVSVVEIEGTATFDDGETRQIVQRNYDKNKWLYFWNRKKIVEDGLEADVLDHHRLNGLNIYAFDAGDLRRWIEPKIEANPYYLVQ